MLGTIDLMHDSNVIIRARKSKFSFGKKIMLEKGKWFRTYGDYYYIYIKHLITDNDHTTITDIILYRYGFGRSDQMTVSLNEFIALIGYHPEYSKIINQYSDFDRYSLVITDLNGNVAKSFIREGDLVKLNIELGKEDKKILNELDEVIFEIAQIDHNFADEIYDKEYMSSQSLTDDDQIIELYLNSVVGNENIYMTCTEFGRILQLNDRKTMIDSTFELTNLTPANIIERNDDDV